MNFYIETQLIVERGKACFIGKSSASKSTNSELVRLGPLKMAMQHCNAEPTRKDLRELLTPKTSSDTPAIKETGYGSCPGIAAN